MTKEEIIELINKTSPTDNEGFAKIISAIIDGGVMDKKTLARRHGVSLPTVQRWKDGITCPHPSIRKAMFRYLARELLET